MNREQIEEIELGIASGVDVTIYAKKEFNSWQMYMIRLGLEKGLDVSKYLAGINKALVKAELEAKLT